MSTKAGRDAGREGQDWQNWSGSQRHHATVAHPVDVDAVREVVQAARSDGQTIRAVGSAHSFVPFWTDDVILSLDGLSGLRRVDRDRGEATIAAGTKLHALGPLLWAEGLSLPQQGDIDRQSLAGALATGTHGTGRTLKSLSNYIRAMTLVTASGELRELRADRDGDLFRAAKVAQGTLGVMVDVTLALDPAFNLHERTWTCTFEECAATHESLIAGNRHFEFFWTPRTDRCDMKVLNKTDAPAAELGEHEYIAPAYIAFPSAREIRFNEMEYSVPYAAGWDALMELRAMMQRDFPTLPWPIEYRTLAADDLMLSSAAGRETVTLSVHQGAERDYQPLFAAAEAIFRNHDGRPHWGKVHACDAEDLARLYPEYDTFCARRRELDPAGVFLNAHLKKLFER